MTMPTRARLRHLVERGREAALGRVVHRVDADGVAGDAGVADDADPGIGEVALRGVDGGLAQRRGRAVRSASLAGEHARPLDGDALRQDERVARPAAVRADEAVAGDLAEHRAGDDRAVEAEGDLRVAADEMDVERGAGVRDLGEESLRRGRASAPSGRSTVARNHSGLAPVQAMSLALTWTAYQPAMSPARVIGSVLATRRSAPPVSMTAASWPMPGPTRTRGSAGSRRAGSGGGRGKLAGIIG